jgi:protease-4
MRHRPLFSSAVPRAVQKPQIKWKILPILWLAFKRMCFFLGASILLSAFIGVYMASFVSNNAAPSFPDEMVLYLPLEGEVLEVPPEASLSDPFAPAQPTVHDIIYAIDQAAADPKVKGMLARLDNVSLSLTHIQEIRAAIRRFKDAGKFTKIYSSSYGEATGGLGRFYLASIFDEIWMQPLGIVTINGIKAEVPYLRPVLDKIGITPHFFQREAHKTAYESLTDAQMSPENRAMLTGIVEAIRGQVMQAVPGERGIDQAKFQALIDQGLFTAQEALDAGLITHMDYADVLVDGIRADITGDVESDTPLFVDVGSYAQHAYSKQHDMSFLHKKPGVALIYAVGAIMDSRVNSLGQGGVFLMGGVAASDEIAEAIALAAEDEDIDTIVLRVDSPGGSPIASERILRALDNAKRKDGKNIVVSMGATAASGGYWVAAHADRIFAMPTTITGSIGVVGGKFAFGDLTKKIGVNWDDSVQWGENAGMWSINTPFTASETERVNAMLDQVYNAFLQRVAEGRKMSIEDVRKIAGGRVWTGERAREVGLVDQLGGLETALDYAATLSGKQTSDDIDVIVLPRPKSQLEQILELLGHQGAIYGGQGVQLQLFNMIQPVLQHLAVLSGQSASVYEPVRIE